MTYTLHKIVAFHLLTVLQMYSYLAQDFKNYFLLQLDNYVVIAGVSKLISSAIYKHCKLSMYIIMVY